MKMNINSIDGDFIKFNWATNKIYIKLVGSTESLERQRIPPVDLTQRMLIIHNKIQNNLTQTTRRNDIWIIGQIKMFLMLPSKNTDILQ